jgi:hypothetical protein
MGKARRMPNCGALQVFEIEGSVRSSAPCTVKTVEVNFDSQGRSLVGRRVPTVARTRAIETTSQNAKTMRMMHVTMVLFIGLNPPSDESTSTRALNFAVFITISSDGMASG